MPNSDAVIQNTNLISYLYLLFILSNNLSQMQAQYSCYKLSPIILLTIMVISIFLTPSPKLQFTQHHTCYKVLECRNIFNVSQNIVRIILQGMKVESHIESLAFNVGFFRPPPSFFQLQLMAFMVQFWQGLNNWYQSFFSVVKWWRYGYHG